jgi:hypothetical protein
MLSEITVRWNGNSCACLMVCLHFSCQCLDAYQFVYCESLLTVSRGGLHWEGRAKNLAMACFIIMYYVLVIVCLILVLCFAAGFC